MGSARRRLFLVGVIVFVGLLAQALQALAINQASSEDDWWWRLDVIKEHSWLSAIVLWVVVGVLAVVTWRLQGPKVDGQEPASGGVSIALCPSIVGGATVSLGVGEQRTAGRDYYEQHIHHYGESVREEAEPKEPRRRGPLRVTYAIVPPLRSAWEGRLHDAVDRVSDEQNVRILCDSRAGGSEEACDVDLNVIMYGAAHHPTARIDANAVARLCRNNNPEARILVAACDYTEESTSDTELCSIVRDWNLGGSWDAKLLVLGYEFDDWLLHHLTVVIRSERRHGRWFATELPSGVASEDFSEGGSEWSDPVG